MAKWKLSTYRWRIKPQFPQIEQPCGKVFKKSMWAMTWARKKLRNMSVCSVVAMKKFQVITLLLFPQVSLVISKKERNGRQQFDINDKLKDRTCWKLLVTFLAFISDSIFIGWGDGRARKLLKEGMGQKPAKNNNLLYLLGKMCEFFFISKI